MNTMLGVMMTLVALGLLVVAASLAMRLRARTRQLGEARQNALGLAAELESLRAVRERLREAQELAGIRTWEWELTGPAEDWVGQTFRLLSFAHGQDGTDSKASIRRIHPQDMEEVRGEIRHAIDSNGVLRVSFRTVGTGGEVRHLQARASVYRPAGDGPPRILGTVLDVTDLKQAAEALRAAATIDGLTGAFTRNHFFDLASREFERRERYGGETAVMMVDVDEFKPLNDAFGHAFGDVALRTVVQIARQTLRRSDIFGRYGGDEFAVVLPHTAIAEARETANRLREAVARKALPVSGGGDAHLTLSIGVTLVAEDDADIDAALKRADKALYLAKSRGRNRVAAQMPAEPGGIAAGNR